MANPNPNVVTFNIRVEINGRGGIALWRTRTLGIAARLLGIPLCIASVPPKPNTKHAGWADANPASLAHQMYNCPHRERIVFATASAAHGGGPWYKCGECGADWPDWP